MIYDLMCAKHNIPFQVRGQIYKLIVTRRRKVTIFLDINIWTGRATEGLCNYFFSQYLWQYVLGRNTRADGIKKTETS